MPWRANLSRNGNHLERNLPKSWAIASPFGNSQAMFLSTMMSEILYFQCFNEWFAPPNNPGKYPDDIPATALAQFRSKLHIWHKSAKQLFGTYKAVVQCLHNLFQEAINEDYLSELDHPNIGLTTVLPSDIYHSYCSCC